MKLSEPYYGNILYSILGAYIPLTILILLVNLLGGIFWLFGSTYSVFTFFEERAVFTAGLLSAIASSVYAGMMKKSFSDRNAADLRGGILAAAGAYILTSFLQLRLPLGERFLPGINAISAVLASLLMWFSIIHIRKIFSILEHLESFSREYSGENLRSAIREFSGETGEADFNIKKLIANYMTLLVISFLFISGFGSLRNSFVFSVFIFFIFGTGFIVIGFLMTLRREIACSSEGFRVSIKDRAVLIPFIAFGIFIFVFLSAMLSSNTSLIPPEIIPIFFLWLAKLIASLFRKRERIETPLPEWESAPLETEGFENLMLLGEEREPWQGWRFVRIGFIAAAVFLFVLFMIHPLLRRSKNSLKLNFIFEAITTWFKKLINSINEFFSSLAGWNPFGKWQSRKKLKIDKEKLKKIASELAGNFKKKELEQSINLFARLIFWGNEILNVSWQASYPPGEYCSILAAALNRKDNTFNFPPEEKAETTSNIIHCGELFEKALYSPQHLSKEEEKLFKELINMIIE